MSVVKICGITTADEAAAAADCGANALGFNFYPGSVRYLDPATAGWIRGVSGVLKVGIFVDEPAESLRQIVAELGLDVAQIHRGEIPAGVAVWRTATIGAFEPSRDPILIDAPPRDGLLGGTGRTYDWSPLLGLPGRIIIAGGLDGSNAAEAIRQARPWGVDACSKLESAPAKKDRDKMRAYAQAAREAFARYAHEAA